MARPTFMAITSTGGYIGRIFWANSGVHPAFPRWGSVHSIPNPVLDGPWPVWAGLYGVIALVVNRRFSDD